MAKNLHSKLPSSDTLRIYDINSQAVERFISEAKAASIGAAPAAAVLATETLREAVEDSVSPWN